MNRKNAIWILLVVILAVSMFTAIAVPLSATEQNKVEQNIEKISLDEWTISPISEKTEFVPGEIIIKFKSGVSVNITITTDEIATVGIASIDVLNDRYSVTSLKKVLGAAKNLTTIYKLELPKDADILSIVEQYQKDPNIEYAEPNYNRYTCVTPNDPRQWEKNQVGQNIEMLPLDEWTLSQISEEPEFVPGEVIIKFKSGVSVNISVSSDEIATVGIKSIDVLNERYSVASQEKIFETVKKPVAKEIPDLTTIYKLTLPEDADILSIVDKYQKDPNVEYAEPNYIRYTCAVPNDPYYLQQWAHQNMQSEQAWDIENGDPDVIIAIVDTGVDWDHQDLAANIWGNSGEIAGNGIDDEGNGYIDDIRGWDFVNTTNPDCVDLDCTVRDNDPMDNQGHGTHCAGIAGAVTDNGVGVAGMAWDCRIMAVRAGYKTTTGGSFDGVDSAAAIVYAADNGADVVSMSFGGSSFSNLERDAINYAYSQGVVLVGAAGNDDSSSIHYPAGSDNVIAVSATDSSDTKVWFSNYGSWVDVAAPGLDINSTYFDDTYKTISGTSMSCPYVAGLVGLILSNNPGFTQEEVKSILHSTTDPVSSSVYIGIGRINAYKAIQVNSILIANVNSSLDDANVYGIVDITGTASGANFQNYTVEYGVGNYPTSWTEITSSTTPVTNGILATWDTRSVPLGVVDYSIKLRVTDTSGRTSEDRVVMDTRTKLYLRSSSMYLSKNPGPTNSYWYNDLSSGSYMSWDDFILKGDINGTSYKYCVWLASYGTTMLKIEIIINGTSVANDTLSIGSPIYQKYCNELTGLDPITSEGDEVSVNIYNIGGDKIRVMWGGGKKDSHIKIPTVLEPDIWVNPQLFDVTLTQDAVQKYSLTIGNNGTAALEFKINDTATEYFADDMESGPGSWTHGGTYDEWELGTPTYGSGPSGAHSGSNCWGTDLDFLYANNCDQWLMPQRIDLSRARTVNLSFHRWFWTELDDDQSYVKMSPESGTPATKISWSGSGTTWTQENINISRYAGDSGVKIKFGLESDSLFTYPGLYIDDVVISGDPDWLTVYPNEGNVIQGNYSNIIVTFNTIGLDEDIYNATIVIEDNDPYKGAVNVPVKLWVVTVLESPIITDWHNDKTKDNSTSVIIDATEEIYFNATSNQSIDTWNWFKDGVNQNNNYDNFTTCWFEEGVHKICVNASNTNGTSNTVMWNITVSAPAAPKITSFAPPALVNDTVCHWRLFNVTVNQTVDVSWYLNNTPLFTNESVTGANCSLHAEVVGEHNVSAIVANLNGTDMQTWIWNVTEVPTCDISLKVGWNLISAPLNLTTWELGEESVVGEPLNVTPKNSLTSIYRYNTTSGLFEKCDHFDDWGWWPATGSENFTKLEPGRGYWVTAKNDCNLTFTGTAPYDLNVTLSNGWNLIGWYSMEEALLGEEAVVGDSLNVTPENSLTSIYRYNSSTGLFEKCDHFDDWGWGPATGSENFTKLEPGSGYWVRAENDCVWRHMKK